MTATPDRDNDHDGLNTLLVERRERVALVTLNRPKVLNALDLTAMHKITSTLVRLDGDPDVGCIVLTGTPKAFAAGADIKEMQHQTFQSMYDSDWFGEWETVSRVRTPLLAAVAGYALGGGCELAMMCDAIYAADTARFGQPEIKLGVMPGMGGSQRLTRLVGKSKAMDMCLTGRMMDADEAERAGLAARVFPADSLLDEVLAIATTIAELPKPAAMMITEAIDRAEEVPLNEGLRFERRLFHSLFATDDQSEGMAAFVEKRQPTFTHR